MKRPVILAVGCCLGWAGAARAAIIFDFELQNATSGNGALTSLTMTQDGLTVSLSRQYSKAFDIVDVSNKASDGFPVSWGHRTLSPFYYTPLGAFVGNLSSAASSIQVEMGDFQPSDHDVLSLMGYSGPDGTGTLVASTTVSQAAGDGFIYMTVTAAATAMQSFVMIGGDSDYPNSVYYDNIRVEPAQSVPEAGTLALLGIALPGLLTRRRNSCRQENPTAPGRGGSCTNSRQN